MKYFIKNQKYGIMKNLFKILLHIGLLFSESSAFAQQRYDIELPHLQTVDKNNVDLTSGLTVFNFNDQNMHGVEDFSHVIISYNYANPYATIGGNSGKTDGFYPGFELQDNFRSGLSMDASSPGSHSGQDMRLVNGSYVYWSTIVVSFQGASEVFWAKGQNDKANATVPAGYVFESKSNEGGSLVYMGSSIFEYTDNHGNVMTIDKSIVINDVSWSRWIWPVVKYKKVTGLETVITYLGNRISSIVRNDGFAFIYNRDSSNNLTGIIAVNLARSYCNLTASGCASASASRASSISWSGGSLTLKSSSNEGRKYTFDAYGRVSEIYDSAQPSLPIFKYTYCNRESPFNCAFNFAGTTTNYPDKVTTVTAGTQVYNYVFEVFDSGRFQKYTKDDGVHLTSSAFRVFDVGIYGKLNSISLTDGTSYQLGDENRINSISFDGRVFGFTYDGRGNVTDKSYMPSDGGPTLYEHTGYDETCSNRVTCNLPNWFEDRNGNRTTMTYDPVHGGLLTVTSPSVNGVSAQKRYTYVQRYSRVLTSSGGSVRAATPIWLVSSESYCKTSAWNGTACSAGASDEVRTDYDYGPDSGGNNLWLRGKVVTADGTSLRTCYGYDSWGNVIWKTTPKAGLTSCW